MTSRLEALMQVTLAIASAAAERNAGFAEALGTRLRGTLRRTASDPAVFSETLAWLARFEQAAPDTAATPVRPTPNDASRAAGRARRSGSAATT